MKTLKMESLAYLGDSYLDVTASHRAKLIQVVPVMFFLELNMRFSGLHRQQIVPCLSGSDN